MSVGGGTPRAEALLEERRRVIRNALKSEFLRKKYNPANYTAEGGMIFDAAVQRWHSMQFCYGDHFKPTFGNFMKFNLLLTFPMIAFSQICFGPAHTAYLELKCVGCHVGVLLRCGWPLQAAAQERGVVGMLDHLHDGGGGARQRGG